MEALRAQPGHNVDCADSQRNPEHNASDIPFGAWIPGSEGYSCDNARNG
jgi:hypothetical protein